MTCRGECTGLQGTHRHVAACVDNAHARYNANLVPHVRWATTRDYYVNPGWCADRSLIAAAPAPDRADILALCELALIRIERGDAPDANRHLFAQWAKAAA